MAAPSVTIEKEHLFLCEGSQERQFWQAFFKHHKRDSIQVLSYDGRDYLNARLPAIVLTPGFERIQWLGVARDADSDAASAFKSVVGALGRASLLPPALPWQRSNGTPTVVVFIWPDGHRDGDVETLVWDSIYSQHGPVASCVDAYIGCLDGANPGATRRVSKAKVYAFLASLPRPEYKLGEAALAGELPFSSSGFDPLLQLLP